ncbi:WLM-domain-containing protein [Athelia psychrophila]|uniref:WLM-domain-containing protein n=1 Tax=Athelia psychrophila TaxID=1759441 RepID=A0A166RZH4_9AGAM|nr:WLM-domain-containing protein [Fibularhizoctonia sp. CBS 109695]
MSNASTDNFVLSYTHLKDRPKSDQALPMLRKIASLVKPIMRKHRWTLPVLAEFFPASPNLIGLNVNGGQKICLRLRPASAPDTFYEETEVVGTMLHELTHNVHGPHDEKFYKFLAGLEDEYYALQRSGYSGEGFFSKGQRVGTTHDLPPHLARAKALAAAEKRRRMGLMSGGGRVGGSAAQKGMNPRQLAAEAADRRARDGTACDSGELATREADKASKESIEDKAIDLTSDGEASDSDISKTPKRTIIGNTVIDLTSDGEASHSDSDVIILDQPNAVAGPSRITIPRPKTAPRARALAPSRSSKGKQSRVSKEPKRPSSATLHRANSVPYPKPTPKTAASSPRPPSLPNAEWACTTCTLLNGPLALQCAACLATRPPDPAAGWVCLACGEAGMEHAFWTCRRCGGVKTESVLG